MWKYRVVENPNEEHARIELLDSKFEGLVYQYGKVTWNEDNFQLNFERTIRRLPTENPEGKTVEDLNKDNDLQEIMGTILAELLLKVPKDRTMKTGKIIQQHLIWNDSNGVRHERFVPLPEWETDEENATEK